MAIGFPHTPSQEPVPSPLTSPDSGPARGTSPPGEKTVSRLVRLFKLLADETRLKILCLLHDADELNVLELCQHLRQRQPSVSHHLALLRAAGLIDMRREGKHNYYRLLPRKFEELVSNVFRDTPDSSMKVGFDRFELRYVPISESQG
jgi:ArsR family transcriptional regulator